MDKILQGIIQETADANNVSFEEAEKVMKDSYKFIRSTIENLELKDKTYEEISELKTNFTMPSLFKLYINKVKVNSYIKNKLKRENNE